MGRLVVISCGARKVDTSGGPVRALDLYTGPPFRVVAKNRRDSDVIYILSALHGLIPGDEMLVGYDLKMTPARADKLAAQTAVRYSKVLDEARPSSILWSMSAVYLRAMRLCDTRGITTIPALAPGMGIGRQLGALASWLKGNTN